MDNQPLQPLLVKVEEAAKILSLSPSIVYELVAQKKIASVKCGAARRVVVASLHMFIAENQVS